MFAAIICIATIVIVIPSPLKGYINLGDCAVLVAGWTLSPAYGLLAAGIGSALADMFAGYVVYMPATFAIKGIMAVIAHKVFASLDNGKRSISARIVSGIAAETIMVMGYFVFEGLMYGFGPSAVNIPANTVQALAGIAVATVAVRILEKSAVFKNM